MMGNEQENLLKKYTTCSNTPEITDCGLLPDVSGTLGSEYRAHIAAGDLAQK
jgi:hypothetical protein